MTDATMPASQMPEFSRPIDVARLKGTTGQDFAITPDAAETRALAGLFAALKLSKVHFRGSLKPFGKAEWELKGHVGATIVQACIVTLEPVTTRIETDVHRLFVREMAFADEVELDAEDDFDLELLGPEIDLGAIATEELALSVPEYPRAAGAELNAALELPPGSGDDAVRPFDALKSLCDRLSDT